MNQYKAALHEINNNSKYIYMPLTKGMTSMVLNLTVIGALPEPIKTACKSLTTSVSP